MKGRRRPRRSDQIPMAIGMANPATALTVITAPISAGASSIRSSRTGR